MALNCEKSNNHTEPDLKLEPIAARARSQPKAKFTCLMHHVTPERVRRCVDKIPRNSSSGVDGKTADQVKRNLSWLLPMELDKIHKKRYNPPPVKRAYIPKPQGGERPIGVPTILDRGIQAATAEVLNQIYEADFLPVSFGFRPGIGCHNALSTIQKVAYQEKMYTVLEVDIRDFFGSLDHGWLMKFLELRLADKRVLTLIESWLKAGVMKDGAYEATEVGTPQGGSISPLLANIYLHYVLDLWWDRKIKRQLTGKAHLVRYCDDFVFLFQNPADAKEVKQLLEARLSQFGLRVAPEKTQITYLVSSTAPIGKDGRRQGGRQVTFLGMSIRCEKTRNGRGWKIVFNTDRKRLTRAKVKMKESLRKCMHWSLASQVSYINSKLRGHYNYYGLPGNSKKLGRLYYETIRFWKRCLSKRSQRNPDNWDWFNEKVLKEWPLVPPRLKWRYDNFSSLAVL